MLNKNRGNCRVKVTVPEEPYKDMLLYELELDFDKPVRSDFSVEYIFDVGGKLAKSITLPEIKGFVKSSEITEDAPGEGHFLIGKNFASGGERLALPAVDLQFDKSLAIAADPFFGAGFRVNHVEAKKGKRT